MKCFSSVQCFSKVSLDLFHIKGSPLPTILREWKMCRRHGECWVCKQLKWTLADSRDTAIFAIFGLTFSLPLSCHRRDFLALPQSVSPFLFPVWLWLYIVHVYHMVFASLTCLVPTVKRSSILMCSLPSNWPLFWFYLLACFSDWLNFWTLFKKLPQLVFFQS